MSLPLDRPARKARTGDAARDRSPEPSAPWLQRDASVALGIFLVVLALSAVFRVFDHDEFEHVHSAWYLLQGYVPYRDFLQHHHPLLWLAIAPVIHIGGERAATLVWVRLGMLGTAVGLLTAGAWIAREAGLPRRVQLLAALLLASQTVFIRKAIEIRPDGPQVLLVAIAVALFLRWQRLGRTRWLPAAGLAAAASFLFLQKSVFPLAAAFPTVIVARLPRRVVARDAMALAVSFAVPLVIALGVVAWTGLFSDYVVTNWLLNVRLQRKIGPLQELGQSVVDNSAYWLLACAAFWQYVGRRRASPPLQWVTMLGASLLLPLLIDNRPDAQDLLLPSLLLAVPAAHLAADVFERTPRVHLRRIALPVALFAPLVLAVQDLQTTNTRQQAQVDLVVSGTPRTGRVYDAGPWFNLYRHDLHYFWYSLEPGLAKDAYTSLRPESGATYDPYALIRAQQPSFISDRLIDLRHPDLAGLYEPTEYEGMFRRRQHPVEGH